MYRNSRRQFNCIDIPDTSLENTCDCYMETPFDNPNNCECGFDEDDYIFPIRPELAQSYVPYQIMKQTFIPSIGLEKGTLFPELVSPYEPCQSMEEIAFIKAKNEIKGGCNDERL